MVMLRDATPATPLNAPGPFYVGKDQCIACMAPQHEAPELMDYDESAGTCYFKRQPQTPLETEHAIQAVYVACCDAVQYSGTDPRILARFRELGSIDEHSPQSAQAAG
jgi:ferredoxin